MALHKLVILTNPTPGMEEEYRDWYVNTHLPDVLKTPGFQSAELLKIEAPPLYVERLQAQELEYQYVAIYEIETTDLAATWHDLHERVGGPEMPISPALSDEVRPMLATAVAPILRVR